MPKKTDEVEAKPEEEEAKDSAIETKPKAKTAKPKEKEAKCIFSKNKDGFVVVEFREDSCGISTLLCEELWNVKGVSFSAQKRGHFLIDNQKLIFKAKNEKKALLSAISSVEKKLDELKKKV